MKKTEKKQPAKKNKKEEPEEAKPQEKTRNDQRILSELKRPLKTESSD